MKINWKHTAVSALVVTSLLSSSYAAMAAEVANAKLELAAPATYPLTDSLMVDIKSVLNESVEGGTRVGVVVRMKNNGAVIQRVPEYELRVKTVEGVEYTLQSSATNPRSIQPKATTDLSYLAVVDRTDTVTLAEANWTEVDYYVYPKKETRIIAIPIEGQSWKGSDMKITDPAAVKKWGEPFTIPSLTSPLAYTPVSIQKEVTDKGTVQVLQLLVTNPSNRREIIPEFIIDGKAAVSSETANPDATVTVVADGSLSQSYYGKKVEQGEMIVESKEQKYIHYVISTDNDTVLSSINLLTPEKFSQSGVTGVPTTITYNVGRLNILLPDTSSRIAYPAYNLGNPMSFDPLSELIHPDLEVSVVEFHINENMDEGSKSVTSKFKIMNKSDIPMAVPVFQTELLSTDGFTYSGNRQTLSTPNILPNSGLVISYSYKLPTSEKGENLVLKINDMIKAAPYKTNLASYSMTMQPIETEEKFSVYPFDAKVTYWTISPIYNRLGNNGYSYKARFNLDLTRQEQIQIDPSFSKLQFELYDSADRLLATHKASFIGAGRLVSGENNFAFDSTSEQLDRPLTIRLYESFTTPTGDAKRLLGVYKQ